MQPALLLAGRPLVAEDGGGEPALQSFLRAALAGLVLLVLLVLLAALAALVALGVTT
jgi:hypothetical protein